jgi:type I restriction enzyme R subunit
MSFELFDPRAETAVRYGSLPHWYQPGVTYFVTFRTEDSVPQELGRAWHARRAVWLCRHGLDPNDALWKSRLQANPTLDQEYHATFTREFMEYLDRGHGHCILRHPEIATIVAEALRHFDENRYDLGDFIVMPNHVHLLVGLRGTTKIEEQCRSWKRFTARRINETHGSKGRFWQEESFDHLVRSPEQFDYLRRYIAENPRNAGLAPGEYLHWVRPT